MSIKLISPKKSVNSAFLKLPVPCEKMEQFKSALVNLLNKRDAKKDEEYHKNELQAFLKGIFNPAYSVHVDRPIDLAIFNGNDTTAKPAVIIEMKSPTNVAEMFSEQHPNTKAFQELVYYFLLEYVHLGNREIKYLVISNFDEYYFFDVKDFIRYFANKSKPVYDQFLKFVSKQTSGNKTSDFYNDIAKPAIDDFLGSCDFSVVHFSLEEAVKAVEKNDDKKLVALYKMLSPEGLLAKPFANDSNSLDRNFYAELLHIIGLEEVKEDKGGKKVIQRKKPANRDKASLLESAIYQLEDDFPNKEECEAMALRLSITWVNRLLFLKLVESQILMYQKGDASYRFMSTDKIANFDELNIFFFKVLGKKIEDRDEDVLKRYPNVPYLNSSLFEPTEDEKHLKIRGIPDAQMEIFNKTVLKDERGKRAKGTLPNLDYIFKFLDAYNFASDAQGGVTSTSKTLINASVLGLIFEKINGYKDGSFFTPGFITDYMARDVLERTVVQKFNEKKSWKCENLEDVSDKIEDISEANQIVDDIRVADVAVGSGHFLVSALNRLLAIKSELNILCDADGKRIKRRDLILKVDNDELSVVDDEGEPFEYKPGNEESQRYQEALFNEKRRIIENCLFGVDLNPNSVNICRLRLWIELLKNAYYTKESGYKQLQTLPNIDINIKVGDSLLSKYPVQNGHVVLDFLQKEDKADKKNGLAAKLKEYRKNVQDYKAGETSYNKQQLRLNIAGLKSQLKEPPSIDLFGNVVKNNDIDFSNSLEWMFEFPEILDDEGRFTGFDAIIGNPPYGLFNKKQNQNIALTQDEKVTQLIRERFPEIDEGMINAAKVFYALAFRLTKKTGLIEMIVPFGILSETSSVKIRKKILTQHSFLKVSIFPERDSVRRRVFEDAKMSTAILLCSKAKIDCPILIGSSYKREIPSEYSSFSVEDIGSYSPNAWQMPMCNRAAFDLMMKLRNQEHYQKFSDVTTCMTGELDMTLGKKYLSEDSTETMLVKGVQIAPYILKTKDEDISQGKVEYVRTEDFFVKCSEEKQKEIRHERIAMQGLSGINEKIRLKATLVPANHILANSANFFKYQEKYSLYFLLAVFNSKLLNFIFKATSTSSNVNGYEVNALPFPRINAEKETLVSEIENNSKRIFELKSENHDVDIAALENEIDKLVYELYDLTEEEIEVVEVS